MYLVGILIFVCGGLAFFGKRWAYAIFLLLSMAWIPARTGFHLQAPRCEGIPDFALAAFSMTNYAHIVLFSVFFIMTVMQFRARDAAALSYATLATIVLGAYIEIVEGATGTGHCRLRDLIPDGAAAMLGAIVVIGWQRGVGLVLSRRADRA